MKKIGFIFALFFALKAFSQTIPAANNWFDKYEYERAATSYEKIINKSLLTPEDLQRWCYSYYVTKNYEKSFQMSDSLIKDKITPSFFTYIHAHSAMVVQKYKTAEKSFKTYKDIDNDIFLDSLIAACNQIPTWTPQSYVELKSKTINGSKADQSGSNYKDYILVFRETGIDKFRVQVDDTLMENAELLYLRPFIFTPTSNDIQPLKIPLEFKDYNIISFAVDSLTKEVFVTMNNPIDKNELLRSPHIYKGKLNNDTLDALQLWEYAGIEDSSSTAHATINLSSDYMVFSKQGLQTKGSDLYFSKKEEGGWIKPEPLTKLNTNQDDMFPLFIGDSLLSFASNGRVGYGGLDIYIATIHNNAIGEIEHLKSPVNSVSDDFNFTYYQTQDEAYFTSNRKGGSGDDDIYYVKFKDSEPIDTTNEIDPLDDWQDVIVYFDFDKSSLKEKELAKINALIKYKETFSDLALYVDGHCDIRGTDAYNIVLGEKRANTVREVLISLGLNTSQIEAISKGKREPAVKCEKKCSESEHHLNRFVTIKLVRL